MKTKHTELIGAAGLSDFDAAEFLSDEETIAAYMSVVAGESNPSELEKASATVDRARRMNQARQPQT